MEAVVREEQIGETARELLEQLSGRNESDAAAVVGLVGELGAGKTTFVQALARELGVAERVTSPTFVIEKIYALAGRQFSYLVHIDAYRLEKSDELQVLGWDALLKSSENLVVVEWADRVRGALPEDAVILQFEVVGEGERKITTEK